MNKMKIGFCCKWVHPQDNPIIQKKMNQRTTTVKHILSLTNHQQYEKLTDIMHHNISALWEQLNWISKQPEHLRLFRITSEFLPLYTINELSWIWKKNQNTLKLKYNPNQ